MNCFPCFKKKEGGNMSKKDIDHVHVPMTQDNNVTTPPPPVNNNLREAPLADTNNNRAEDSAAGSENSGVKTYTFRELAAATKNFRQECLLGEGGFGRVFKGILTPSGETVAIRQLDRNGAHGGKEFAVEISKLSLLSHPNLVKLIGYCADGDQRLLVYEYMPSGSLKNHLFDVQAGKTPLDWSTRMKIALGIAEGLEFLHEKTNPSIIYRDLKSSNILLDSANNPRLSEYGLAKLVQSGNSMHVAPRLMGAGAYGYCAPEYERHGELTLKSDVYSFGVVLLELITGRVAMDTTLPTEEQNIVSWAQPIFRDPSRFPDMADPLLRKHFPVTNLNQAVGVAAMCLQEEPSARPLVSDITAALSFLAMAPPEAPVPASLVSILSGRVSTSSQFGDNMNSSRLSTSSLHGDNMDSSRISTSSQFGEHIHSLREKNISWQQNEDNTDISDTSDDSDDEEKESTAYDNMDASNKSQSGFNEAKTLGLSSKRNSKKTSASEGYLSRSSSRSNSIGSRDYSIGNSLRCDSNFQGRSNNSSKQEFQDYDDSSSSNEELSNQRSRNKSVRINSRNGSRRDAHDKSLSSKNRQESLASSYSYSSSEDEYEEEEEEEDEYDRSNDRPEIANSRNNNIVNPGSGDQNTNKGIADSVSGYKGQDRSTVGSAFVHKVKSVNNVRSISKVKSGVNNKVRKAKSGVTRRP